MNTSLFEEMSRSALNGTLRFPDIVQKLTQAGVESYHVDYVRNETRYYMSNGESHVVSVALEHDQAATAFSAVGVFEAVRAAQAGRVTYPEFTKAAMAAGTVFYMVYLSGKRVIYFGRNGDSHTEWFPGSGPKP